MAYKEINVKTNFGAKGDGITDDTIAIQAAFDNVESVGDTISVFFPPGEYLVSGTLNLPYISSGGEKTWKCFGYGATLTQASTTPIFENLQAATSSYTFSYKIEGFQFKGTDVSGVTGQTGLHIGGNAGCSIRDCKFYLLATGVHLENCIQSTIDNCNVIDCEVGIRFGSDSANRRSIGNSIRNSRINTRTVDSFPVYLDGPDDTYIDNVLIEGETCKYHVYLLGDGSNDGGNVICNNIRTTSQARTSFKVALGDRKTLIVRDWSPRTDAFGLSYSAARVPYYSLVDISGSKADTRILIENIQTNVPRFNAPTWSSLLNYQLYYRVVHSGATWVAISNPGVADEPGNDGGVYWKQEGDDSSWIVGNASGTSWEVTGWHTTNSLFNLNTSSGRWDSGALPAIRYFQGISNTSTWYSDRAP